MTTTAVVYTPFDIGTLFGMALPIGLFAATLLGGPLSKENNGHLELAWTKPVSRERYALAAMGVDLATVVIAQVATVLALLIAGAFWDPPKVSFDALAPRHIAFALLLPAAWYACLTAFSASLKRGPGAVLGIGWVVAVVCPTIATATLDTKTAVGRAVHAIFDTISYADPITYFWLTTARSSTRPQADDRARRARGTHGRLPGARSRAMAPRRGVAGQERAARAAFCSPAGTLE